MEHYHHHQICCVPIDSLFSRPIPHARPASVFHQANNNFPVIPHTRRTTHNPQETKKIHIHKMRPSRHIISTHTNDTNTHKLGQSNDLYAVGGGVHSSTLKGHGPNLRSTPSFQPANATKEQNRNGRGIMFPSTGAPKSSPTFRPTLITYARRTQRNHL